MRKTLDNGTYGNSKCAYDLVTILNDYNDQKFIRKTGSILHDYFIGVNDIVKTTQITETLLKYWKHEFVSRANNSKLPTDIKTRLCNLISAKYKELHKLYKEKNVDFDFVLNNGFFYDSFLKRHQQKGTRTIYFKHEKLKIQYLKINDNPITVKNKLHFLQLIK
jgi:hypothetical protein